MLENYKLANLLVKFEEKIDSFVKDHNIGDHISKELKELIQDKLNILNQQK